MSLLPVHSKEKKEFWSYSMDLLLLVCYYCFFKFVFITLKDNYVVVYELLDEMLDNGFPLATEANILKEMIKPPNILRTVVNSVTGNFFFDRQT